MPITTLRSQLECGDHLRGSLVVALGKVLLDPALLGGGKLGRVGASGEDLAASRRVVDVFFEVGFRLGCVGLSRLGFGSLIAGLGGRWRRSAAGAETEQSKNRGIDQGFHGFSPWFHWCF